MEPADLPGEVDHGDDVDQGSEVDHGGEVHHGGALTGEVDLACDEVLGDEADLSTRSTTESTSSSVPVDSTLVVTTAATTTAAASVSSATAAVPLPRRDSMGLPVFHTVPQLYSSTPELLTPPSSGPSSTLSTPAASPSVAPSQPVFTFPAITVHKGGISLSGLSTVASKPASKPAVFLPPPARAEDTSVAPELLLPTSPCLTTPSELPGPSTPLEAPRPTSPSPPPAPEKKPPKTVVERQAACRARRRLMKENMYEMVVDEVKVEMVGEVAEEVIREMEMEREAEECMDEELEEEEEEQVEGGQDSSRSKDAPYGAMADRTYRRHKAAMVDFLLSLTTMERMELVLCLAARHSLPSLDCPLRHSKLLLSCSATFLQYFLAGKAGLPSMSRYRRKVTLTALYTMLATASEPEIVVEGAVVTAVLADKNCCLLLNSLGLVVDSTLLIYNEEDTMVSTAVMERIMASARQSNLRYVAIDHACEVAGKLGLRLDTPGNVHRLKLAIK